MGDRPPSWAEGWFRMRVAGNALAVPDARAELSAGCDKVPQNSDPRWAGGWAQEPVCLQVPRKVIQIKLIQNVPGELRAPEIIAFYCFHALFCASRGAGGYRAHAPGHTPRN